MTTVENSHGNKDGSDATTISLEAGHRFNMGKLGGVAWNWVPSISYAMTTTASNTSGVDDVESTDLSINAVNFAFVY